MFFESFSLTEIMSKDKLLTSTTTFWPKNPMLVIMSFSSFGICACWINFVKFSSDIPTKHGIESFIVILFFR